LLGKLKAIEAQESSLQAEIDSETAKAKALCPPVQAYKALRGAMPVPTVTIDRAKVKRLLPDILEKIVVHLGEDEFRIHFKGGQAHGVKLLAKSVKP